MGDFWAKTKTAIWLPQVPVTILNEAIWSPRAQVEKRVVPENAVKTNAWRVFKWADLDQV